jgi:hypothetical protein
MPNFIGDFDTVGGDGKQYSGGAGGIRTLDRALQPYNGLANRRLQPLGHSSVRADMPDTGAGRKRQIQFARDDLVPRLSSLPAIGQILRATMPFRSLLEGVSSLSHA